MRAQGRTAKRIKKLMWHIHVPGLVNNHGVLLPTNHPLIPTGIRKEIFFAKYESKEVEIVAKRLAPDDIVMEVGAGIGFLSALCAKRIGSERVFTYEANPALMEVIAITHQANKVMPTVMNALLAQGEGTHTFFVEKEFWASSAIASTSGAQSIEVPRIDLNSEVSRIRPSFLIVDIEGGEIEFFATANLDTVRKICVETHPGTISDADLSRMFQRLFEQGFALDFSLIRKNVFFLHRP